ncbi:N-acetyltransferase family protein [Janthinobacterium sp. HLX7-2]|uniref:GNAT family N-acetyltransferase n=1 Tax=Janthinobacterium sp. HLX7-2 TaxID=1259331 RepID=UPI003F23725F
MAACTLVLRPAAVADAEFMQVLYASTRDDLRAFVAELINIDLLILMQHKAQITAYRSTYPEAEYLMIERQGEAIGSVVINSVAATLRIVDISVLPSARRQGCAGEVLLRLQGRAAAAGQEMCLCVHQDNPGARRLYLALGFAVESEDALCAQLQWRA